MLYHYVSPRGVPMMHEGTASEGVRMQLERLIAADLRDLTSESDWIARTFAEQNKLSANEFRALLFVMVAETDGVRLTAGDLRKQMRLSGAAITYLVERMTGDGHLRRETDPADRRKVILRYGDRGMDVARRFFTVLGQRNQAAMAHLSDTDLEAAHRTFRAMIAAMKSLRDDRPAAAESAPRS
jgi:MarR family transcriptional regulator, organic hydroperoxide resistance regulator